MGIPGFIEGVIGMNIKDEKILKCEFPKDYHQEEAKGRKAEFKVILEDLKIKELPELNDDFAKQASDKENMSDLRADLEKILKENKLKLVRTRFLTYWLRNLKLTYQKVLLTK